MEHYTPKHVVAAARAVLGTITLDPASCEGANEIVKAEQFYSKQGLEHDWHGHVFLNPPGGRIGKRSSAAVWWAKLSQEWQADRVLQAVFIGFTLEILRSAQHVPCLQPLNFPFCVPKSRLKFSGKGSPPHANVVIYLPPKGALEERAVRHFRRTFEPIGACCV